MPKYTRKTVLGIENFMKHLKQVRKQGFGFSDEDVARGVRAIAAPILDSSGNVVATIGISLPSFQLPKSRMKSAAKAVKDAASDISRQFGWKGDTDFKSMRKGAEQ